MGGVGGVGGVGVGRGQLGVLQLVHEIVELTHELAELRGPGEGSEAGEVRCCEMRWKLRGDDRWREREMELGR